MSEIEIEITEARKLQELLEQLTEVQSPYIKRLLNETKSSVSDRISFLNLVDSGH